MWADLTGANALELRYVLGDQTDQLLARVNETTGSLAYYLTDDLGSVRLIMDSSGTVLNAITYDAYGNILTQSNASYSDRYKYTGREFDAVSGLQYNRGRYYNASTGSWLSQDPLGFAGGDSNLYRYVGNDPTGLTDPNGTAQTAPQAPSSFSLPPWPEGLALFGMALPKSPNNPVEEMTILFSTTTIT